MGIRLEIIQMLKKKKKSLRVVYAETPGIGWTGERIARAEL